MMIRFVHFIVVAALVAAAAYVYEIKFESAVQADQAARLAAEIKRERDVIATLRAEWVQLENPARTQALVHRHLTLKMLDPVQIEQFDRLPERPPVRPSTDPIATIIDALEPELPTAGAAEAPARAGAGTAR
jgi:cell division protein FtsL